MENKTVLVTGGARSGKSEYAESLAAQSDRSVIYVATASRSPADQEWNLRIQQHQQRRPQDWQTREVPILLASILTEVTSDTCLLIDSLGTWVANLLDTNDQKWDSTVVELLESIKGTTADLIFVAEETGWGVIPAYASGRLFRDRLGSLTRQIGAIASEVYLVTGGYALDLTKLGVPLNLIK